MTIKEMTDGVCESINAYPAIGTKPWSYKTAIADLPTQVGSLTKLFLQMEGYRYAHGKNNTELKDKIADELADILSLVLFISREMDIDIEEAYARMLQSDKGKQQTQKQ